jgi:hypothetical protein
MTVYCILLTTKDGARMRTVSGLGDDTEWGTSRAKVAIWCGSQLSNRPTDSHKSQIWSQMAAAAAVAWAVACRVAKARELPD